jgi:hypothetical protein
MIPAVIATFTPLARLLSKLEHGRRPVLAHRGAIKGEKRVMITHGTPPVTEGGCSEFIKDFRIGLLLGGCPLAA